MLRAARCAPVSDGVPVGDLGLLVERQLCSMKVVVLGSVPVHLLDRHRVAEERVPAHREVHPSVQGLVGFGVEASVEIVEGAVQPPGQPRAMEDQRTCAGTEVVDEMERSSDGVQNSGETTAERVREPGDRADEREQPLHQQVPERYVPEHLLVGPPGAVGLPAEADWCGVRDEVVKVCADPLELRVNGLSIRPRTVRHGAGDLAVRGRYPEPWEGCRA